MERLGSTRKNKITLLRDKERTKIEKNSTI